VQFPPLHFWPCRIFHSCYFSAPAESTYLAGYIPGWFALPKPVTNRARCWLTSLIRPTSLTTTPHCQLLDYVITNFHKTINFQILFPVKQNAVNYKAKILKLQWHCCSSKCKQRVCPKTYTKPVQCLFRLESSDYQNLISSQRSVQGDHVYDVSKFYQGTCLTKKSPKMQPALGCMLNYADFCLASGSSVSEWVSRGLTSHSTLYRSFWGRFLQARWPNQQI